MNPENELNPYPFQDLTVNTSIELIHYTSIFTLLKIIKNKQLKFNRIDNVNDLTEKELLEVRDNYKRVFVSCFSRNIKETIPMWKMYTNIHDGIMLKFIPKKDTSFEKWFELDLAYAGNKTINFSPNSAKATEKEIYASFNVFEVEYNKSKRKENHMYISNEKKDYDIPEYFATYKDKAWKYEKEMRFRLVLKGCTAKDYEIENYFSLFLNINFDAFQKIIVVFSPTLDKNDWNEIIEDYRIKNGIKTKFIYKNSRLYGKVKL